MVDYKQIPRLQAEGVSQQDRSVRDSDICPDMVDFAARSRLTTTASQCDARYP